MQLFANPDAAVLKRLMSRPGVHPDAKRCDFCGKTRILRHNADLNLDLCSRRCREGAEAAKLELMASHVQEKIDELMEPYADTEEPEAVMLEVETLCGQRAGIWQALARLRGEKTW